MNLGDLAGRVEAAVGPVKWARNNTEFKSRCPCHDERTASANYKVGSSGNIVAFCFGCGAKGEQIAAKLGIDIKEFFAQPANGNGYKNGSNGRAYQAPPNQKPQTERKPLLNPKTTRYRILDPDAKLIAVHVRLDGIDPHTNKPAKRMWWEAADGSKGLGSLAAAALPLYGCQLLKNYPTRKCRW
jgi:hypothetical protein